MTLPGSVSWHRHDQASSGEPSEFRKFEVHSVLVAYAAKVSSPEESKFIGGTNKFAYATARRAKARFLAEGVIRFIDIERGAKGVVAEFADLAAPLDTMAPGTRGLAALVSRIVGTVIRAK